MVYGVPELDPAKGCRAEYELPCRIGSGSCNKVIATKENVAYQVARLPEYADDDQLVYGARELLDGRLLTKHDGKIAYDDQRYYSKRYNVGRVCK
jgi:hypothetical protein